jgi:hypothetical protein
MSKPVNTELRDELCALLNKHSADSQAGTPDFILAQYLLACLDAFGAAIAKRETWLGRRSGTTGE